MNVQRCAATMATLTIFTLTSGCAVRAGAPFHIYGSPTLQGDHDPHARETSHRRMVAATRDAKPARERSKEPRRRAVARASRADTSRKRPAARPRADSSSPAPRDSAPSLPSLSISKLEREPASRAGESPSSAASYVWEELDTRGVELSAKAKGSVPALYRACAKKSKVHFEGKEIGVGHVVFFHNTFDANGDERNNDWYTHAALVVDTDGRNRATLVAYQDGAVREIAMNLSEPGGEGNDQLRSRRDGDAPFTRYMSGELFAGSCAVSQGGDTWTPNLGWRP